MSDNGNGDNGNGQKPMEPTPSQEPQEETRLVMQLFVNRTGQVFIKTTAQLSENPVYLVDILTKALRSAANTLMTKTAKPTIHIAKPGFMNRVRGAFGGGNRLS